MKLTRLFFLSFMVLALAGCSWPGKAMKGVTGLFGFGSGDEQRAETLSEDDRRILFEEEMGRSSGLEGVSTRDVRDARDSMPKLPDPGRLAQPKDLKLIEVDGPAPSPENDPMLGGAPMKKAAAPRNVIPDERMDALEQNISMLESNVDLLRPAYQRIEALEGQMVVLMQKLNMLVNASGYNAAQQYQSRTPVNTNRPSPVREEPRATQPRNRSTGAASIIGYRTGLHRDKTRLVFDVTGNTDYRYDLDPRENLLMIEMPNASWDRRAGRSEGVFKDTLFSAYSAQPMEGGGVRIIAELKHSARVIKTEKIAASSGKPARIYFDLRSGAIHR